MGGRRWSCAARSVGVLMEILIRIVDKGATEDCSKSGDVISVCPDGWAWSPAELTNPDWRIVKANILQTHAGAFLSRANNPLAKRRREWRIDFSLLPNPALFTGPRTQAVITLTRAQVVSAAVKKP